MLRVRKKDNRPSVTLGESLTKQNERMIKMCEKVVVETTSEPGEGEAVEVKCAVIKSGDPEDCQKCDDCEHDLPTEDAQE